MLIWVEEIVVCDQMIENRTAMMAVLPYVNRGMRQMDNIVLIGMPGAGKSTVGVVLAKRLGLRFVDCDLVIQEQTGKLLHEIIAEKGIDGFLAEENRILASLKADRTVLATGGSAIYGKEAMTSLKKEGIVVYLQLSYETVKDRLGDLQKRGVTLREGQDLSALYRERVPYYEAYADIVIDCENKNIREVVECIAERPEIHG